jgi:hypothetical protein
LARAWSYHSPPASAVVKNVRSYTSTPPICLHGLDRDNFTFLLLYFQIIEFHVFQSSVTKMSRS